MATRDGSDAALKFHPMDSPAAAPIGIHLKKTKKCKKAANSNVFECSAKLPKLRTWVRFPSLAP
jgi:hypothetical protein